MKKIGIVTIYDEDNYGNRLQNYAVQIILERLGFDVQTIRNINIVDGIDYLEEAKKVDKSRRDNFLKFNENIKIYEDIVYHDNVDKDFHNKFDYFIVGSDQVWNYSFPDRFSDFMFLDFAPENKRIALSASFGVGSIPVEKENLYKKVVGIKKISVRENAGQEILKKYGVNDSIVLIDPTMMLNTEDWQRVMVNPEKMLNKKYIFKYFLGPVSEERKNKIEKFAQENDLEIIDILDKNGPYYCSGPSEFLSLIQNAEIIFTDSFHSCVFSLLFEKNFLYFRRDGNLSNINSRLETLFKKFNIEDRFFCGALENSLLVRSAENISRLLLEERKKFNDFLIKSLNIQ